MIRYVSAIVGLLVATSCRPTDGCTPAESRCTGQSAEICDSNGRWQTLADCDVVSEQSGAAFVCGYTPLVVGSAGAGGYTCLPKDSESEGAGGAQ